MVMYFKNQRDFARALIEIIDSYWAKKITEKELHSKLVAHIEKNPEKTFDGEDYTSILKQRLGKKRIILLNKILNRSV